MKVSAKAPIDKANKEPHNSQPKALHLSQTSKISVSKKLVGTKATRHGPIKVDAAERQRLQTLISTVSKSYDSTANKAKEMAQGVQKTAHEHSAALQHKVRTKAAAVMFKAKKKLRQSLKVLQATLTDSVDKRERAVHDLEKLKASSTDEVELAQASLTVAQVNKETNLANAVARKAAKKAHTEASETMKMAKRTLASRIKAIKNTELLTINRAQLQANVVTTESKYVVSKAKQDALLELEDTESETSLEQIVGKDAVTEGSRVSSEMGLMSDDELLNDDVSDEADEEAETIYTAKMGSCKFPFLYNGKQFFHCKSSAQGSWCATHTDESTHEVKKWDYCVQNNKVIKVAKEAAMQAAKLEIKRVLTATGGTLSPAALRESLRAAAAARKVQPNGLEKKDTPPETTANQEDLKSRPAVIGEQQAASSVDKMIADASIHEA